MLNADRPTRYCAYVLRLWEMHAADGHNRPAWRCSVEDPHTGERRGFASLEALMTFLQTELTQHHCVDDTVEPTTNIAPAVAEKETS